MTNKTIEIYPKVRVIFYPKESMFRVYDNRGKELRVVNMKLDHLCPPPEDRMVGFYEELSGDNPKLLLQLVKMLPKNTKFIIKTAESDMGIPGTLGIKFNARESKI